MRVAFPYMAYWPYARRGIERCIHDLAGYLADHGHEVQVITSTPGRPREEMDGGVRVTYLRQLSHPLAYQYAPGLRGVAFAVDASRVLAATRPDVVHLWHFSVPWAPVLRRWIGMPYLFHVALRGVRLRGAGNGPLRRLQTMDLRRADQVVALTPGGAREVEEGFGVSCGVLPPPVDMRVFRPVAARDEDPAVLFTSDLTDPLKGGRLLLRSWSEIRRRSPRARLVLAGPYGVAGYNQSSLAAAAAAVDELVRPEARDSVELRGPGSLGSLPEWYSRASVTVMPSIGEAFGMVLTESLACGTPVVASSSEGPGEIVTNPEIGRTIDLSARSDFESGDRAHELAEAVLSAIDLSRNAGSVARCREWASRWSLDSVGAEEERLLEDVLERRPRAESLAHA